MNVKLLTFFLLVLFSFNLDAQEKKYTFQHLGVDAGLSNSSVYCIIQDKEGYLWFGTADGLNKFDGEKFKIYKHSPFNPNSLPDNWITTLAVDKKGDLWIGTYGGGLSHLEPRFENFENFNSKSADAKKIKDDIIRTLYFDEESEILWIGTERGLNEYDTKNHRLKKLFVPKSEAGTILQTTSINALFQDKNKLYVGTWGKGLLIYDTKSFEVTQIFNKKEIPNNEQYNRIKGITKAANGQLWIAYRGAGLYLFNPKTQKFAKIFNRKNSNLSSDNIYSMVNYQNKSIWLGTYYNGLNKLNLKTDKISNFLTDRYDNTTISGNWIPGLFLDRTNILWIGTDKGASKLLLEGVGFNYYTVKRSNLNLNFEANINAIYEAKNNKIWLGTWGQGVLIFDRKIGKYSQIKPNGNTISSPRVWNILEDKNGQIWIGTGRALDMYNPATNKWLHYYSRTNEHNLGTLPANNIASMTLSNDSTLMVGTWGGGITTININSLRVMGFDNSAVHGNRIKTLFKDSKGRIWIGSSTEGLSIFNPQNNSWKYLKYQQEFNNTISGNDIECVAEGEKFIWVATNNSGLNKIDKTTFAVENILKRNGLPTNSLRRIVVDSLNNLWISSQAGVIKYNPNTREIKSFDKTDGLQSNEFTRGYAYLTSGEIAFGGNNGFNIFHPNKLIINKIPPKITISEFYIYNKKYNLYKKLDKKGLLKLHESENMISFEFRALDYNAPQKNQYLYKLEGFDDEWRTPLSKPIATYTNLSPGKYTFRVIASNNHGFWNTDGVAIKIRIYAPIYKTWEFFVAIFLLLISLSLAYVKYRELDLRKAAIILDKKVEEKTKEVKEKNKLLEEQNNSILQQNKEIEIQKHEVEAQRDAMEQQRDLIQEQKQQLTDSIIYAQTIQMAMMPDGKALRTILPKSFLLFKPKDIVSGDFVWIKTIRHLRFIAVADCTGHGVPGGFMSMFGISILNELVLHEQITDPAELMEGMRNRLIQTMNYKSGKYASNDGIDIGVCIWNTNTNKILYSGAHIPLYIVREKELIEIPGDKMSVGQYIKYQTFETKEVQVYPKDKLYLFTDGYSDQFGGNQERKFMKKNLKKLILETSKSEMVEQEVVFLSRIEKWMGSHEQLDDITGLGFEI